MGNKGITVVWQGTFLVGKKNGPSDSVSPQFTELGQCTNIPWTLFLGLLYLGTGT